MMPSSTSLLEADEGESEVPPPLVHAFAGMGLEEHHGTQNQTPEQEVESISFPHHHQLPSVSQFSFLDTVLDLKPLPLHRPPSGDEASKTTDDEELEADDSSKAHRRHQRLPPGPSSTVMPSGMDAETVLLYGGEERDDGGVLPPASVVMLPPGVYGEPPGYEAEPSSLLSRRKSVNTTECVAVPSSEHVAEIVGRQGECPPPHQFNRSQSLASIASEWAKTRSSKQNRIQT